MRYVISDLHFGHGNAIGFNNRPFDSTAEMNKELVKRWNNVVDESDTVIVVGDVELDDTRSTERWIADLNGNVLLVRGNHDKGDFADAPFHVVESAVIRHGKYTFYVEHQPAGYSGWSIHGHTHNSDTVCYPFINAGPQTINVSAELIRYTPLPMHKVAEYCSHNKTYTSLADAEAGGQ